MRNLLKQCAIKSRLDQKEFRQEGVRGWCGRVDDDLQESRGGQSIRNFSDLKDYMYQKQYSEISGMTMAVISRIFKLCQVTVVQDVTLGTG